MLAGTELGHESAHRAARSAGADWVATAYRAFENYAKWNRFFTTEEVRNFNTHVPKPPDPRAWGAIALMAQKENIVESAGWTKARSLTVHGMVVTKWKSRFFDD